MNNEGMARFAVSYDALSFCFRGRTAWPRIFCSLIGHRKPQNLRHDFNSAVSAWKIVIFVSYAHAPAFCVVNIKKTASGETPYFYVQLPCVETPIQSCAEPAHTIIIHSSLFTIHYSFYVTPSRRDRIRSSSSMFRSYWGRKSSWKSRLR